MFQIITKYDLCNKYIIMSIFQQPQTENFIHFCTFQCFIRQAGISMKFPCSYLVEWCTSNKKEMVSTDNFIPENNKVLFNTKITMSTQMLFNRKNQEYLKKQTSIDLLLISKSRPDKKKLVGKINIDVAKIANFDMYSELTEFHLDFNSAEGSLAMQFKLTDKKITENCISNIERSAFINCISRSFLNVPSKNQNVKSFLFDNRYVTNENKSKIHESLDLKNVSPSHKYKLGVFANLNEIAKNRMINGSVLLDSDNEQKLENGKKLKNLNNLNNLKSSIMSKEGKNQSREQKTSSINPAEEKKGTSLFFEKQQRQKTANSRSQLYKTQNELVKTTKDHLNLRTSIIYENSSIKGHVYVKSSQKSSQSIQIKNDKTPNVEQRNKLVEDKVQSYSKQLEAYQSVIKKYSQDQLILKAQKANLQQQISLLTEKQRAGNEQKAKLYEFLGSKDKVITQLYEGIDQKIGMINKLQNQIYQLKKLQDNKNNKNNQENWLNNQNANLQNQNRELRNKIMTEAKIAEIRRKDFLKLEVINNNLENELRKYHQIVDGQKTITSKLKFQLELSQKLANQLNEQLVKIQKKMEQEIHVIKLQNYQKMHQLRTQMKRKDQLIDDLKQGQSEIRSLYVKNVHQLQDLQSKWSQLSSVHQQEKQKVNQLANHLKQLAELDTSQQFSFQQENINFSVDPTQKIHQQSNQLSISQSLEKRDALKIQCQNWEERCHQNELMIDKLNSHLQQQINQNNKLQQQYIRQIQKVSKLKDTLIHLEQQSKQILTMAQEKQQNEEIYIKTIQQLEVQICQLRAIFNAENQSSRSVIYPDGNFEPNAPGEWIKLLSSRELIKIKEKIKMNSGELSLRNDFRFQINSQLDQCLNSLNNPQHQNKNKFETQTSEFTEHIFDQELNTDEHNPLFSPKCQSVQKFTTNRDNQTGTWKSVKKQKQIELTNLQKEMIKLKKRFQDLSQQKFILQQLVHEKDVQIQELSTKNQDLVLCLNKQNQKESQSIADAVTSLRKCFKNRDLSKKFEQSLKNLIDQRITTHQTNSNDQNLHQNVMILSKELQKLKSKILKVNWRSQNEKITILDLFKRCQSITSEIISASEFLNSSQISTL